jgi:hypothetical protein
VAALRLAGIDVLTTVEAGRQRASDEDQLLFAAAEHRVLYTANRADFARLHRDWLVAGRAHAGIITRSRQQLNVSAQILGLRRFCSALEPAAAVNLFEYLEA